MSRRKSQTFNLTPPPPPPRPTLTVTTSVRLKLQIASWPPLGDRYLLPTYHQPTLDEVAAFVAAAREIGADEVALELGWISAAKRRPS